jgi:hypothetical protein
MSVSREMPQYQCHKKVWALKIKAIEHNPNPDATGRSASSSYGAFLTPSEPGYGAFEVDASFMCKHNPQVGGYYVVYEDGYKSYSPAEAFEGGYAPLVTSHLMSFGAALQLLKEGARVARAGWNGKGQFVYLVPPASYPVQTGAAKAHFGEGSMVPYNAYLALKTVDGTVSTWAPSVSDCLAEDWLVVPA